MNKGDVILNQYFLSITLSSGYNIGNEYYIKDFTFDFKTLDLYNDCYIWEDALEIFFNAKENMKERKEK